MLNEMVPSHFVTNHLLFLNLLYFTISTAYRDSHIINLNERKTIEIKLTYSNLTL